MYSKQTPNVKTGACRISPAVAVCHMNAKDTAMPRLTGEAPPAGFMLLPVDVYEFKCQHAGCGGVQKQTSPVRDFRTTAAQSTAPREWWWCDDCRQRTKLRESKQSASAKKLAKAALHTSKISWARAQGPDGE